MNASDHVQTAQDIKEQAAQWLARSVSEQWSAQDQAELDAWLAQATAHKLAYWRLDAGWRRSERLAALRSPAPPEGMRRNTIWSTVLRAAAGIASAVIIGVLGFQYFHKPEMRAITTPIGGHKVLTLADGSTVELNTDTVLRIAADGNRRTATLDRGEAFFSIKHDANHPFVVMAGVHRITDLGTKFAVRQDVAKLEVSLVEGKARLETGNQNAPGLVLRPGDVAVATTTDLSVVHKAPQELSTDLSWRRGVLIFDGTPLAQAAAEFNRYNTTKLVVADAAAAKISIGGTFQANNVAAFAEVAQGLLKLQVQKRGADIVISR
jgi:transmembrane sensor